MQVSLEPPEDRRLAPKKQVGEEEEGKWVDIQRQAQRHKQKQKIMEQINRDQRYKQIQPC